MFTCAPICRFSRQPVASQTMNFRELVERRARGILERTLMISGQLGRALRFRQRLGPRAAEAHDLRAMHQALSLEGNHCRPPRGPATERGRPFARAIEV